MRIKSLAAATAALSLVASPVLANPASPLSVSGATVRASSDLGDDSNRIAGAGIAAIVAVVIGAGIIVLATDGDDDVVSA